MAEQGQLSPWIIEPPDDLLQKHKHLQPMNEALAHAFANGKVVSDEALQAVGSALWNALNLPQKEVEAQSITGLLVRPIIISSKVAALHNLPWETLYHPQKGFLARNPEFALSRTIPGIDVPLPALEKGPLRVLLFTTLPEDLHPTKGRLNVEQEQANVLEALMPLVREGWVRLEVPDDGRFSTLKDYLHDFKPHLVYLSSHGKFIQNPQDDSKPYGILMMEDEDGYKTNIKDLELANAFRDTSVQCVVLSACESGKGSSDNLNQGLVRRLYRRGVSNVVGMRESVYQAAGINFARSFFSALADRKPTDTAVQRGRKGIMQPLEVRFHVLKEAGDSKPGAHLKSHWSLPLLLSQESHKKLINWDFTPEKPVVDPAKLKLHGISLPKTFVGRRKEMRKLTRQIRRNKFRHLLIIGPGGQGKTALAGRVVEVLKNAQHQIFAFS